MKRFLFAGLVAAIALPALSVAQDKSGYTDDVYYTASQAEQEAQQEAVQQSSAQKNVPYYNSSGQNNDQYNNDNARVYNDGNYSGEDDGYIDYDDDSYATRIRRFYYPMNDMGYWGSVYYPYWSSPFYTNPYYGWGGWYTPGISMSFGFGPYWNSCWGINTWYGYGGFNSWYYPYYGYGWGGYGAGFWNGYYAGLYEGGYGNSAYRGRVNYGPRGSRSNIHTVGNYGSSSRTSPINRSGMVNPQRGNLHNDNASGRNLNVNRNYNTREATNRPVFQTVDAQGARNTERTLHVNTGNNNERVIVPQQESRQRNSIFGRRENRSIRMNTTTPRPSRNMERTTPERSYTPPARTYSAPSRSYSAPSRSYSAPSGGSRSSSFRR